MSSICQLPDWSDNSLHHIDPNATRTVIFPASRCSIFYDLPLYSSGFLDQIAGFGRARNQGTKPQWPRSGVILSSSGASDGEKQWWCQILESGTEERFFIEIGFRFAPTREKYDEVMSTALQ
jgi:hypothetical protein